MDDDTVWWVSFASPVGNLGVVITENLEDGDAIVMLRRLFQQGINPGGDVQSGLMPLTALDNWELAHMNQLIPPDELHEQGYLTQEEYQKMVGEDV